MDAIIIEFGSSVGRIIHNLYLQSTKGSSALGCENVIRKPVRCMFLGRLPADTNLQIFPISKQMRRLLY